MEGSVRWQSVSGLVRGVGEGREQGGQEKQQLAHPCKVQGGLKHAGAEWCAERRAAQKKEKTGCGGLAEGVEQPGQDEECDTEQESDTNAGVDGCSTNGN